ncbi:MAG TPA: hypothetical protein VGH44_04270 [Candidatus Saccharimonadia bacterium]|jgi:predicted GH43/DUF377 family glycosyl hydrolase
MNLVRHQHNPILEKNPDHSWEAGSVFNPTVWEHEPGQYGMLYRATNDVNTSQSGRYVSSIGLAWSQDGINWERQPEPLIKPDQPYENSLGCEDPRITKLGDTYYIFYTAVSQHDPLQVRIALATTTDFKTVQKYGVIGPDQSSKAATLFPEPINGKYNLLWADQAGPDSRIILSHFDSLEQLTHTKPDDWTPEKIAAGWLKIPAAGIFTDQEVGARPIKTPDGWLFIFSGFSKEPRWTICAALLDLADPSHVLATTPGPLLLPETEAEKTGVVNNVCFPEGALIIGNNLYVYYGSGDQGICLATCKLTDLIAELKSHPAQA